MMSLVKKYKEDQVLWYWHSWPVFHKTVQQKTSGENQNDRPR
jgi:hypothetical protein